MSVTTVGCRSDPGGIGGRLVGVFIARALVLLRALTDCCSSATCRACAAVETSFLRPPDSISLGLKKEGSVPPSAMLVGLVSAGVLHTSVAIIRILGASWFKLLVQRHQSSAGTSGVHLRCKYPSHLLISFSSVFYIDP